MAQTKELKTEYEDDGLGCDQCGGVGYVQDILTREWHECDCNFDNELPENPMPTKSKREELRRLLNKTGQVAVTYDAFYGTLDTYEATRRSIAHDVTRDEWGELIAQAVSALPSLLDALDVAETALKGLVSECETLWRPGSVGYDMLLAEPRAALATIHNL